MPRQSRKRNIIVSGLVSQKDISDTILFEKLVKADLEYILKLFAHAYSINRSQIAINLSLLVSPAKQWQLIFLDNGKFVRQSCNAYTQKAI